MMKYKVGDRVNVRKDINLQKTYGSYLTCNDSMVKKAGLVVTIKECDNDLRRYKIDADDWNWCDEMFEGLAEMQSAELKEGLGDENTDNGNTIRPGYYQSTMGDIFDIANAYGLDFPLGNAVKYICRAGKKDKSKEIEDLRKAIKCIKRAIALREGK
jgi:hypothetical protein